MEESGSRRGGRSRRGSTSSSVAAISAAGDFPSWVLLEPFVLRRDDDDSFPDVTMAPIRASATTSWGAEFSIAFSLAKPPQISRLYAKLPVPGFPDRNVARPLSIVATHHHLALVRVATLTSQDLTVQNFFIFRADKNPFSLKALPPCTEPVYDYAPTADSDLLPYLHPLPNPRLLDVSSLGLWCQGQEFVVAELTLLQPINRPKIFADICLLHCSSDGDHLGRTWNTMRVKILSCRSNNPNLWQIRCWSTDTVIPFRNWLCWIDYERGILFCDMSKLPDPPTVSYTWFPVGTLPLTANRTVACSFFYRGVSVVDHGLMLKFVNVTRHDGDPFGALEPRGSFTITCHTLVLGNPMVWKKDYKLTSGELWAANSPDLLPRGILMFPRVDINRPHVVHFLLIEFGRIIKKMSVVAIDMSTKTVESCSLYINGEEGLKTDDVDLIVSKSRSPKPFLACEFSKFLSRFSKDVAPVCCLPTSS